MKENRLKKDAKKGFAKISIFQSPKFQWQRGWDSNPRYLSVQLISSQSPSTTRTPLHYHQATKDYIIDSNKKQALSYYAPHHFFKLRTRHHDEMPAARAFQPEIHTCADNCPRIAAAGMFLFHTHNIIYIILNFFQIQHPSYISLNLFQRSFFL